VHKSKIIPGLGIAIGLLFWIFARLPQSTQQILAYITIGSVVALLIWGMWKFRAQPERKTEPPDR
jgi:membrane protein CcdC involved in cytochrome C biogenesis